MKPKIILGAIDQIGNPRTPIIALGPITKRGKDFPPDMNHADYVDKKGSYDIVKFQLGHKEIFPAVFNVVVGQLSPYLTSEVDYETLFSQTCHITDC